MDDAVLELGKFAAIPTVGGADEVTSDALQSVDIMTVAVGALLKALGGILVAAVHATVAVVVDRAVTHVVLVHEVHNIGNCLGVVGGITVNLDVEDVATTGQFVIGSLNLGLVLGRALVIDRHVVAVGVIDLVGHTGDLAEVLTVAASEFAAEALGGRGKDAIVVLVAQL